MKIKSSNIEELTIALQSAKEKYKSIMESIDSGASKGQALFFTNPFTSDDNYLISGDNLEVLNKLIAIKGESSDGASLIYIDPPFYSGMDRSAVVREVDCAEAKHAYKDNWDNLGEYLEMMVLRLLLMKHVMADDGLIFVHVDWHAVHYIRLLMDEVFGEDRFVNEIIWTYKSGGSSKRRFARKHDNILVYSKSKDYRFFVQKEKSYNRGLKPYRFKDVEEFQDDVGWYTLVNMKDVWNVDMVGRTSSERNGYATQKPEKLMERIILSATEPGDLVCDFFCGSGSMGASCAKFGRRFIMSDIGELAIKIARDRLKKEGVEFSLLQIDN